MELVKQAEQMILQALPGAAFIYQFGSYGTEYETAKSDLDLAFFAEQAMDPLELFRLQSELSARLGRKVDLIELKSANTFLAFEIVAKGRPIYIKDEAQLSNFYLKTLSQYYDLQITLRPYFEEAKKRGSIL